MLVMDFRVIGNKLFSFRKRKGMTQAEVAEAAGLSDRTYADIERGTVNMRIETILKICDALHITPNEVLVEENCDSNVSFEEIRQRFDCCSAHERNTALKLLSIYFDSINK